MTRVNFDVAGRAMRRGISLASIATALILVASVSAAAPALFTGVGKQAGGIIGIPTLTTTIAGPTPGPNAGTASVSANGGFTVPASAFSRATPGYTFTLAPVYPYVYVRITQMNDAGSFVPNYLTPSVPVVGPMTNAVQPAVTGTPRGGFVRVTPGPNGFGGQVAMDFTKIYRFDIATSLGILKAKATDVQSFGGGSVGQFDPGGIGGAPLCCSTYPSGSPQLAATAAIGSSKGPWVTGMAFAYDPHGAAITTTTQTGTDARTGTGFDQGVISLVTPRIQYVYQGDGAGTLTSLRDSFSVIHSIDVSFAPEPGSAALIGTGLLGLIGLARVRGRCC